MNAQIGIQIQACLTPKPVFLSLYHTVSVWALLKAETSPKTWMQAARLRMWPQGTGCERQGNDPSKERKPICGSSSNWQPREYLLLVPVGAFEEPYRMYLRIGRLGVRSGRSIFPWAPVSQWSEVALETFTALFPYCACQIEGQVVPIGVLCPHTSVTLGPERGVHSTGSKQGAVRSHLLTRLVEAYTGLGTSGSFWNKRWNWGDMSGAQRLWDTLTSYNERVEWTSRMSPFIYPFSQQRTPGTYEVQEKLKWV